MKFVSDNNTPVLYAVSSITGQSEYLTSTNHVLNSTGGGGGGGNGAILDFVNPLIGANVVQSSATPGTYGLVSLNPDGSNISGGSGGGGTQYTDGGVPPAHPIGNAIEWNDGSNWQTVSTAKPLPVTATLSLTNYALETGGNLATLAGAVTASVLQDNIKQINGVVPLMGNGVTGTGSQRVTIASDNTAFAVNATLSAETTKVIGTVNQGTSPWVTNDPGLPNALGQSNMAGSTSVAIASDQSAIPTAITATDIFPATQNITAQDIATSTVAGFQGQTFIIGTPTANSSATFALSGMTTVNIQTTGIWTGSLRIEASADGGTIYVSKFSRLPGTVYAGAATVTSNAFLIAAVSGCTQIRIRSIAAWTGTATIKITESINEHLVDVLNPIRLLDSTTSTLMTIKPASTAPLATDTAMVVALSPNTNLASGQPVINGEQTDFTGTFTNATQTGTVVASNLDGYGNVLISINGTYGTATAIFEGSDDSGTTWYTVQASRDNTNVIETGYTSLTNTSQTWQINNPGFDSIRVRSTAVASGTVNVRMSASAAPGAAGANVAIGTALPAGTNIIGKVGIDQTTPGTTNLVALTAETTKVIGVVRTADGSGNLLTSTANALDINIKSGNLTTLPVTNAGTFAVQNTAATPAGTNAIGTVNLSPTASGGWSAYGLGNTTNAALTTTQTVSAAAGKFGGYMTLINLNSSPVYIQVFDTTGAVTLGTTAPVFVIAIPANSTAANGVAANMELANGLAITNGIKIAATTTSNGSSTVATGVTGTILFK